MEAPKGGTNKKPKCFRRAMMNQEDLIKMVAYEERAEGVRTAKQLGRYLKCGEANLSVVPPQFTDQKRHDEGDARWLGPESM